MKRLRKRWRELGDTLIEVTLALAILSVVLLSTTVVTTRAFQVGQTARERTSLVNEAQDQMEALRSFRDSNTWEHFLYGDTTAPSYSGVLTVNANTDCKVTVPCWHMVLGGTDSYVPEEGKMDGKVPTSFIEIAVFPDALTPPREVEVVLSYGSVALGGVPDIEGHIKTKLTDLNYAYVPTPAPPPPPTATPTPTGTPTPTPTATPSPCGAIARDIVIALDASHSMFNEWPAGSPTRAAQVKTAASTLINGIDIGPGASENRLTLMTFVGNPETNNGWTTSAATGQAYLSPYTWLNKYGTYYTPTLNAAGTKFGSARPGAEKVLIFLTDGELTVTDLGEPSQVFPIDTWPNALAAANNLKSSGVKIYTIGVGGAINGTGTAQLTAIAAGSGGFYTPANNAAALNAIMASLAASLGCP